MQLYVDPGLRACGAAVFDGAALVAAALPVGTQDGDMRRPRERAGILVAMAGAVRRWADSIGSIERLIVELPQIYPRGHQLAPKAGTDPNDLVHLAAVVGALSAAFATVETEIVLPAEWKGQIPKKIMHARVVGDSIKTGILAPAEKAVLPKLPVSKLHNTLDAVAMGLVDVGRMKSSARF